MDSNAVDGGDTVVRGVMGESDPRGAGAQARDLQRGCRRLPGSIDADPVFHYIGAMKNIAVTLPEDAAWRAQFRSAEDGRNGPAGLLGDDGDDG